MWFTYIKLRIRESLNKYICEGKERGNKGEKEKGNEEKQGVIEKNIGKGW
jgi:hypothetical protein